LRLAAKLALQASKIVIKLLAYLLGMPVAVVAAVAVTFLLVILAFYGAMPYEAQAAPEKAVYEKAAEAVWPGAKSADGAEEAHRLTWGTLMAVDRYAGTAAGEVEPKITAEETARKLAPRFEYRESTVTIERKVTETVKQPDGSEKTVTRTETTTKKVLLLVKADTYRGVYTYSYKTVTLREGDAKVTKEVQDSVSFVPDWSRLIDVLKERSGGEAILEDAIACHNLGLAFDAGKETLAWLGDEEDVWITDAAGSWESDPSLPPPAGKFIWPAEGRVTSWFGPRIHPLYGDRRNHNGIDIAVSLGTPVRASADGVVRFAGWKGGFGLLVAIDHGGGVMTFYGHNSELLVKTGQRVSQGDVIALSGSTGDSTGPHIHFEVRVNGKPVDPVEIVAGAKRLAPDELAALFRRAGQQTGLDPGLIEAVAWAESGFDPDCRSEKGAIGLMQLMPETAKAMGCADPYDPEQNVLAGARYLKGLLNRFGRVEFALAAYNAGPSAVEKYHGIPPYPETQAYVAKVMRYCRGS
jgi:murein DD-endopeptidase MepM/ murein hydrolase activator NlpD